MSDVGGFVSKQADKNQAMVNSGLPLALGIGIPVGSLSLTLLSPGLQEVSRGSEHPPRNLTADS